MPQSCVEIAPAKINLYLEITGRRPNGYHDLDSLVVFADVGERLIAAESDDLTLDITGPWAGALDGEADNLILRAARLLKDKTGINRGVHFTLDKHIPVAAGVGGGSADAAAALRALNKLWALELSEVELCEVGLSLGADVPVCVRSRTSRFLGIGDICLDAPPLPKGLGLLLVNPRVVVNTRDVFKAAVLNGGGNIESLSPFRDFNTLKSWLEGRRNDLEGPAKALEPVIEDCLHVLREGHDDAFVAMSGSGATCFALYDQENVACNMQSILQQKHECWWSWAGPLFPGL
ncbi:MAG: 4-(cytidine 5'-diphospho)-2-C-methyl-D-erythritol kinase [Sphingomonadales bacterium]|jgi:4-diphosphocytidyl-2-C-methyl-D-erythritol kinase